MFKKNLFSVLLFLFSALVLPGQTWDPDAGIIQPFETTTVASSGSGKNYITDGNPNTFWESTNPLPSEWIKRPDLNFFLSGNGFSITPKGTYSAAFDGNQNTKCTIAQGYLEINFEKAEKMIRLSVKGNCTDTLFLDCYNLSGLYATFKISAAENYRLISFHPKSTLKTLILRSNKPFDLFELALLHKNPTEWVIFDLGQQKPPGWISSRHYNANVKAIDVYGSNDHRHWKHLTVLNPNAIAYIEQPLREEEPFRYVKVVFTLPDEDYRKAVLWEMKFYDRYGPYGPPPPARPAANNWNNTFGINTIWGWGYSVYSDRLPEGTGPGLFGKIAGQVRSYHRLDWDIPTPQTPVDFDAMKKSGTPAKNWLNWDREYQHWKNNGFRIDATLMFNNNTFPDTLWKEPFREAFRYGRAYALHFYKEKKLVNLLEIGNEPWNYSTEVYREILRGMTDGVRSVSNLPVLSCAVQAFQKKSTDNNYIARFVTAETARNLAGLNTHIYPYLFDEKGERKALNPEDPRSQVWAMNNLYRFLQKNMPGKGIYITEFGYDSDGGGEECTHPECVSEELQAVYGVRMALILWRLGAKKLFWYYFANVDYNSFMHNRSGLTASYKNHFRPKRSFYAFEKLKNTIGNYRFMRVLSENENLYAYELENQKGKKTIIAWRPTGENYKETQTIKFPVSWKITKAIPVTGTDTITFYQKNHMLTVNLSGIPVVFQ